MQTEMKEPVLIREKYWSELTDPEKIDRMRQMVKRLLQEIDLLSSSLETLQNHVHVGEHLYTRRQAYGMFAEGRGPTSPKDDEVFF